MMRKKLVFCFRFVIASNQYKAQLHVLWLKCRALFLKINAENWKFCDAMSSFVLFSFNLFSLRHLTRDAINVKSS